MKKINEKDVPFKYEKSGPKYLFNEKGFSGGIAYLNPGDEIKIHTHEDEKEIFYFIKGTPLLVAGNEKIRMTEGDGVVIDVKEEHAVINDTMDTVKLTFTKIKER
ncbi:MAG: cupin domain-containing protein [Candidatus Goldbacteria bacterium]|nr:cupin domain-containing protein [Candidatus Goldiibacteriota bacterium]